MKGATRVRWESREPQEEIYLVAGRFTETSREISLPDPAGTPVRAPDAAPGGAHPGAQLPATDPSSTPVMAMAFLREPDENLANRYLEATGQYLEMYTKLLGPYPYGKFALVENFWETGYGMPSFTLLGSKVIRLPFILRSSYPHEILHNWWGNGVYVDVAQGNWSEGLTAYLADHLIQEQQGTAEEYRQTTLQKYTDYVSHARDFPLSAFRERHSSATEAVGYGKSLMAFHMLRRELGDEAFVRGLRAFYTNNRFREASFDDLRCAFEDVCKKDLRSFFAAWTERPGAPLLRVSGAQARAQADGWRLTGVLAQTQTDEPWPLSVPVAVTLAGREAAWETTIPMNGRQAALDLLLPARPVRVDVDPAFDLFRRLDRSEIPPALSQAFGAERAAVILPSAAPADLLDAYRTLAEEWKRASAGGIEVQLDRELEAIPADRSVWILGWENRFLPLVAAGLGAYGAALGEEGFRLEQDTLPRASHSLALALRHPGFAGGALAWVASDSAAAVPGLGRKLPHYHKYSYLGFEGNEPTNILKGRWPVVDSPMTIVLPAEAAASGMRTSSSGSGEDLPAGTAGPAQSEAKARIPRGRLATREALAALPPAFSKARMLDTVRFLAGEELRGRGLGTPELDQAADVIAAGFREAGLLPGGDAGDRRKRADEGSNVPGTRAATSGSGSASGHVGGYAGTVAAGDGTRPQTSADMNAAANGGNASGSGSSTHGSLDGTGLNTTANGGKADDTHGKMGSTDAYFQVWRARADGVSGGEALLKNVIGVIPGRKPEWAGQSVVVSAHYDHLGLGGPDARRGNEGRIHPGADDNASGVAVLLELARQLGHDWAPDRTVVFVAFSGEEAGRLGSRHYVEAATAAARWPAAKCLGAINLDTVGRLGAGKLLVLGSGSAREWPFIFSGAGYVTGVPVEAAAGGDPGASDQKSFLDVGVPAVQLFSGSNLDYHTPADSADKIDADGLVKVAAVAREAIDYLAGRAEPLTAYGIGGGAPSNAAPPGEGSATLHPNDAMIPPASFSRPGAASGPVSSSGPGSASEPGSASGPGSALGPGSAPAGVPPSAGDSAPSGSPRKVSLGTVPDFAYSGTGVRLTGTVPGSPAEKAGLQAGDVIVRVGDAAIPDLRALSEVLKTLQPGDTIAVHFLRDGKEQTVQAGVVAR